MSHNKTEEESYDMRWLKAERDVLIVEYEYGICKKHHKGDGDYPYQPL